MTSFVADARIHNVDYFDAYVEAYPAQLACWRGGDPDRYGMLARLDALCHQRVGEAYRRAGPTSAFGHQVSAHHNALGIAASWAIRHMRGPTRPPAIDIEEREALLVFATSYWGLRDVILDLRAGVRDLRIEDDKIRIGYRGNLAIDLLDIRFGRDELVDSLGFGAPPSPRLAKWIATDGLTTPWPQVPYWVRKEFLTIASAAFAGTRRYLRPEQTLVGFTARDFEAYWIELLAWGLQIQGAGSHGSVDAQTRAPLVDREPFCRLMADRAGISERTATAITERLTMDPDRCPDGALTPLVPIDNKIFLASFMILSTSPQRNLIAALHADNSIATGHLDRVTGRLGEEHVVEILERMAPGVLVARGVKLVRPDRSLVGEIDVVVCHPASRTVACFEVKWDLGADDAAEIYKSLQRAQDKREQVIRHRHAVENRTAKIRRPPRWPDITDFTFRWFVLANNVLVTEDIDRDGVTIRSAQLLERSLPAKASMTDLVDLLDHLPTPAPEDCTTFWHHGTYGELDLEIEVLGTPHLYSMTPSSA